MSTKESKQLSVGDVFDQAKAKAFRGGLAGAGAMVVQVSTLMWLRTTMNYQYRNGGTTTHALKTLYAEGGVLRFYRGYTPALLQGPLSRFGDTAANVGCLAFMDANESTKTLPTLVKTLAASLSAAAFRIFLMPIDTVKTTMQVQGKNGLTNLSAKMAKGGPFVLYHGALGAWAATFAGHYPWFATYNMLNEHMPKDDSTKVKKYGRNAFMGFWASVVSDTTSNSLRVIKTVRQTSEIPVGYMEAAKNIIATDGLVGLFGRGLKTRIIANGTQGMMFAVAWKILMEKWDAADKAAGKA